MLTWIISDTHGYHSQLHIPKVDLAIFCGDEANSADPFRNELEARPFFDWYTHLPIKHKVYIPGNHSTAVFKKLIRRDEYPGLIWLEHEQIEVEGLRIFGSPYAPIYGKGWCYMYKRHKADQYWDCIPENIDILITHGPPQKIMDLADDQNDRKQIAQVGCKSLLNRVLEIKPKIHCFGHIHSSDRFINNGILEYKGIKFVNASCFTNRLDIFNQGYVLDIT